MINYINIWMVVTIIGAIFFVAPIVKYMITNRISVVGSLLFYLGCAMMVIGVCVLMVLSFKMAYIIIRNYYIG